MAVLTPATDTKETVATVDCRTTTVATVDWTHNRQLRQSATERGELSQLSYAGATSRVRKGFSPLYLKKPTLHAYARTTVATVSAGGAHVQ